MTPAELHRLRAEVASDRTALAGRIDELRELDLAAADPGRCAQAAVALHHAYGAIEAALARVARVLEGSVPSGSDWHQALLAAMALEIPTVRPRVLSPMTLKHLRRLLAFRHFFRHAYAVSWDVARLASVRDALMTVEPGLARDLDALDTFLTELAGQLT